MLWYVCDMWEPFGESQRHDIVDPPLSSGLYLRVWAIALVEADHETNYLACMHGA